MIDNSTLVLFGARGNLAKVKLIPGLFHLDQAGKLPKNMKILSVGRQEVDESEWHTNIKGFEPYLQLFVVGLGKVPGQLGRECQP